MFNKLFRKKVKSMRYKCLNRVVIDSKAYELGDHVELNEQQAAELLAAGAVKLSPKAFAKGSSTTSKIHHVEG